MSNIVNILISNEFFVVNGKMNEWMNERTNERMNECKKPKVYDVFSGTWPKRVSTFFFLLNVRAQASPWLSLGCVLLTSNAIKLIFHFPTNTTPQLLQKPTPFSFIYARNMRVTFVLCNFSFKMLKQNWNSLSKFSPAITWQKSACRGLRLIFSLKNLR